MMTNLKYWLKGLAVAALSMIIYAVALGCYMALMLLVISMEEGGDNLSAFSVPLTEALVLLSQGIGFKTDAITLTIVPLLLTVLLIALIAQLSRRFGTSLRGFAAGLVFWEAVNIFFARSINIEIVDSMTMIAIKRRLFSSSDIRSRRLRMRHGPKPVPNGFDLMCHRRCERPWSSVPS